MNEGRPHNSNAPGHTADLADPNSEPLTRQTGPGRILIADRELLFGRALARILRTAGHKASICEAPGAIEAALLDPELDVVVFDFGFAGVDGIEMLAWIERERSDVQSVVTASDATIQDAVACMRGGAFDFLAKPIAQMSQVGRVVERAVQRARFVRQRGRGLAPQAPTIPDLIGQSPAMQRLLRTIESLRHSESHVLIQGESGTGKELVARAIHGVSPRYAGPFVPVDCGALPESVIESELFGHERGAFTGAVGAPGLFRMAERGTLFLDEIGEIPLAVQAKLLRALQYKEVRPVGAKGPSAVNIRVVTATHRDLAAMVEINRFRTDLYYRLNVVRIEIPPLRERSEDIPLLVHHLLQKHERSGGVPRGIEDAALAALMDHDWPGNIRELEHVIESALVFARATTLRVADVPVARTRRPSFAGAMPSGGIPLSLDAYERSALERALREAGGNATEAARRLGIGRSTFYRKLSKHGIPQGPR